MSSIREKNDQMYALLDSLIALAGTGWNGSRTDLWAAVKWPGSETSLNEAISRLRAELHVRDIKLRKTGRRCGAGRVEWELTG
jgi:hypothetical protein